MCTMLLGKKEPATFTPTQLSRRDLEYLYARRSALDNLIESLEDYGRFRAERAIASEERRKTA
jgi:hypothetical protein